MAGEQIDWEPMVDIRTPASSLNAGSPRSFPMVMRRLLGRKYIYRPPTDKEIEDFIADEAW